MKVAGRTVLLCSCEDSQKVDAQALARVLGTEPANVPNVHRQLCRSELSAFRAAIASGPVLVACGQEAPLFLEMAQDADVEPPVCVDIRDRAGWSSEADQAAPKMAALLAEAVVPRSQGEPVVLHSAGRVVVLGADATALEAASRLAADRSVQLILPPGSADLPPPDLRTFTLWRGRVVKATGGLGNWTLTIEGLSAARPSSRHQLEFDTPRPDLALLQADVVVDLSGEPSPINARDGWIVVDSRSALAVERAIHAALDLMGEFEKPRYVSIDPALCAHSRNGQVGCTRCLDVCPSGALITKGDAIMVDAVACSGHGACASVCPTGAIAFHADPLPQVRTLLSVYGAAGGSDPVLLLHGEKAGSIAALARHGDGLPARVLPLEVAAPAALGPELLLEAVALGAAEVVILPGPGDHAVLGQSIALVNRVLTGLGLGPRIRLAEAPELGWQCLSSRPVSAGLALGRGTRRQRLQAVLAALRGQVSTKIDVLALEPGDPFGTIAVDLERCTLCMACAVVCPSKALVGNLRDLTLHVRESDCSQCGLCRVVCPEKAVALEPRLNWAAPDLALLKQDEPAICPSCGKAFAPKSSIERMVERLKGHSMFEQPGKLDVIRMCEDCRGK